MPRLMMRPFTNYNFWNVSTKMMESEDVTVNFKGKNNGFELPTLDLIFQAPRL